MKLKTLLALFFIGLFTSQTFAQRIDTTKIDDYINYLVKENQDIGNISIFKNGKGVYNRSFGQSNIPNLQFNKNTKYHIGSITKLFTATLIWQLIEKGKLKLDEKLATYFPEMPDARNITIKNLLEHSSGLGDYLVKQDSLYFWLEKPVTENDILKEIKRQGILFEPSNSVSYSNSGYYLLAKIVEKEYNNTYGNILKKQITIPLHLLDTYSIQSKPTNVFASYWYSYGIWKKIKDLYYENVVGVGDMVSTTKDLNRFIIQLFSYKILSKETIEKMKPIVGKEVFGRGLQLTPFREHISYGHAGDTYGTHSLVFYNSQNALAISYAINGERYPHNNFVIGILKIIYGISFEYPKFSPTKMNPEILKKYLGTYSSSKFPIKLTVTEKDSVLTVQATWQSSFQLEPYEPNKFRHGKEIKIEFYPKKNLLILTQDGEELKMKRKN